MTNEQLAVMLHHIERRVNAACYRVHNALNERGMSTEDANAIVPWDVSRELEEQVARLVGATGRVFR